MPNLADPKVSKIVEFSSLLPILEEKRKIGQRIIQCHGVFDLLHPGHIRHFQEARRLGDLLVVSVTPDRFVNKGPGRPAFPEALRLESIAALEDVDYVVLNDSPDAVSAIAKIAPHFYVKGSEYSREDEDVTGKIKEEKAAVLAAGGAIHYTDDIVFSSSSLLNRFFDASSPEVTKFIASLKRKISGEELLKKIETLSDLKVLIVGDAIIDEYVFTNVLGQTGKGIHLVAKILEKRLFLGGSLIIANHIAQYAGKVSLLTALGSRCPHFDFIDQNLDPKVDRQFAFTEGGQTLTKTRFVSQDGSTLTKLFETYSEYEKSLNREQTRWVVDQIHRGDYDLVIACDFGNGFTNQDIIHALCDQPRFLCLNVQVNSGNRGYNVITNYRRADYVSINEPELRLSAHDRESRLEGICSDIAHLMNCRNISVTQGVKGVYFYTEEGESVQIPAFATTSVDRIGAGDSYLSLSSLCLAKGWDPELAGFVGSVAAAMSVQMIGNQEAIKKIPLCKYITRILK